MTTNTKTYAREGRRDRKRTRLGLLAQMYFDLERLRVSQQVRQSHLKLDNSPFAEDAVFERTFGHLLNAQNEIDAEMVPFIQSHACWTEFNLHVKGCGIHLLALIMGLIRDVTPLTSVSKLWWLCGLGVNQASCEDCGALGILYDAGGDNAAVLQVLDVWLENFSDPQEGLRAIYRDNDAAFELATAIREGSIEINDSLCPACKGRGETFKAARPTKGEPLNYDARLKMTILGRLGSQLLRNGDPFARQLYDSFRRKEELKKPEGAHRRSIRKVMKLWVACLWDVWRRADGLPVTPHYAAQHLNHSAPAVTAAEWVEYNQRAALSGRSQSTEEIQFDDGEPNKAGNPRAQGEPRT